MVWYEDPDYREEVLMRDYDTGEVLEQIPGSLRSMPDGQRWRSIWTPWGGHRKAL